MEAVRIALALIESAQRDADVVVMGLRGIYCASDTAHHLRRGRRTWFRHCRAIPIATFTPSDRHRPSPD
jgi:hypothetical protein